MAGSSSSSQAFKKTHLQDPEPTSISSPMPRKPPKSKFFTAHFFSKSLIIILVLVVFSLFPSQAPEFVRKNTIATKLWELIYLLVIGIAVSYGLFSRKMDSVHSSDEFGHLDDKNGGEATYLSGISHISSIFEDGLRNSCGFDDKTVFEEFKSLRFSKIEDGVVNPVGKKLSQYFIGESMVVLDDENYVLEQLGKPKIGKENKPLGLPVRSLRLGNLDSASVESSNGGGSSSSFKDSSNGGHKWKNGKFRGLVPIRLEEKFNEVASPPPVPWRSKSMRMEKKEDMNINTVKSPSRCRPLSIGVFEFEDLKSQSMRFPVPSQMKQSSSELSSSCSSSSKLVNLKIGEVEGKETTNEGHFQPSLKSEASFIKSKPRRFSIGTSSEMNDHSSSKEIGEDISKTNGGNVLETEYSPLDSYCDASLIKSKHQLFSMGTSSVMDAQLNSKDNVTDFANTKVDEVHRIEKSSLHFNGDASFIKSKHRQFSMDTSSEMNAYLSSKENVKDFGKGTKKALFEKEKKELDSSNSSQPATLVNAYRRGKSVRTIRPGERAAESKEKARVKSFPSHTDEKVDTVPDNMSIPVARKRNVNLDEERKVHDDEPHSGEVDRKADAFIAKFKERKVHEERKVHDDFSDAEPHSGEVDRKADAFIAKFKEQIRLQRAASSRRLNL